MWRLSVRRITQALSLRKFVTPASEAAWTERLDRDINFHKVWNIKSFFATPRDQITWLKLHHRNLYTVGHRVDISNKCMACDDKENQEHLATCPILVLEYWEPVIQLLRREGGLTQDQPEDWKSFLILGRVESDKYIDSKFSGVMFLAWRCIYAEIQKAREEETPLDGCKN